MSGPVCSGSETQLPRLMPGVRVCTHVQVQFGNQFLDMEVFGDSVHTSRILAAALSSTGELVPVCPLRGLYGRVYFTEP